MWELAPRLCLVYTHHTKLYRFKIPISLVHPRLPDSASWVCELARSKNYDFLAPRLLQGLLARLDR
jgi:hypothetical protein